MNDKALEADLFEVTAGQTEVLKRRCITLSLYRNEVMNKSTAPLRANI